MSLPIESRAYGVTRDGQLIDQYTLRNNHGVEVSVINFGGIVTCWRVPDNKAEHVDIVLGYDSLEQYESCQIYMGCIAGRFANRIANATFELDGQRYYLEANNNGHHLHGGPDGFHKAVWAAQVESVVGPISVAGTELTTSSRLVLEHTSEDGHGGYPGSLSVRVAYALCDDNRLTIDYEATTDKPTVVNLTSHAYFNLRGHQYAENHGVLEHELEIASTDFIPTSKHGIPLPSVQSVVGTPMDFRSPMMVGDRLFTEDSQLSAGAGYDHTWVLRGDQSSICKDLTFAARLTDKQSGRQLEVHTSQPGLQFYVANHVRQCCGKSGIIYDQYGSICLETQHFPDSPNRSDFPATVLRPGEILCERTVYQILF